MNRSSTILIIIVAHQAAHHSRGHSLQQRTECCWGTLELPEGGSRSSNFTICDSWSIFGFALTSPSFPRAPGSRGPSVKGKHLRGLRRLKFMLPIPNCPKVKKKLVGMRTIIFAQMASCSFCWNPIEEGRETYLGYSVAASGLKIVSSVTSISRDQLWELSLPNRLISWVFSDLTMHLVSL